MATAQTIDLDVLIFGGGSAGLWLLDELHRSGYQALLLESGQLGAGQTLASQGIIHGGLKYSLKGMLTASADTIREMPDLWRRCLSGEARPHLGGTRVRAQHCHLWRSGSWGSMIGLIGAAKALRVVPVKLERSEWPAPLAQVPGEVFRLDEQVISPHSLLDDLLSQNRHRILQVAVPDGVQWSLDGPGQVKTVRLKAAAPLDLQLEVKARHVIFTAGAGNVQLRQLTGLPDQVMQRRPLHMVMARGLDLPVLNGHCTDASATRVTITSDQDSQGRTVWQIGGQVSEAGVAMEPAALVTHVRNELAAVIPGLDLNKVEFATYRVDRAEAATAGGLRPEDASILQDGNVITAWPTKLALVPRLVQRVKTLLPKPGQCPRPDVKFWKEWPRPAVALPPWEQERPWYPAP